jgi:hypothetical protein
MGMVATIERIQELSLRRLGVSGLIDVFGVSDPDEIKALARNPRIDRGFAAAHEITIIELPPRILDDGRLRPLRLS